jgi:hypothetical protein
MSRLRCQAATAISSRSPIAARPNCQIIDRRVLLGQADQGLFWLPDGCQSTPVLAGVNVAVGARPCEDKNDVEARVVPA